MITIQRYVRAQSLEEAYELNQKKRNRIVGGMLWMKMSRSAVDTVIDLCDLGLDKIEETEEEFSIGSTVSLRSLEKHSGLNHYTNGAVEAALHDIVGVQFRNMATVGGSIWGRFGFSDVLTVFLAMDTYVELYKGGIVPLSDFAKMEYDNDILIRIIVKKRQGSFSYTAHRNQRTDFPVINCAVSNIGGCYRAVIGARPGKAVVVMDDTGILSGESDAEKAKTFAEYVASVVPTQSNLRGSAEYRSHLVKVLTERCTLEIGGRK
ncbi:MAG: FAD binding domain-containing protein [Clostridia bacterium]|nr:FAD binding domain-containing protein [Clostridia bacterium]